MWQRLMFKDSAVKASALTTHMGFGATTLLQERDHLLAANTIVLNITRSFFFAIYKGCLATLETFPTVERVVASSTHPRKSISRSQAEGADHFLYWLGQKW